MTDSSHPDCPFCSEHVRAQAIETCGTVWSVPDAAPVAPGHCLVITRRHTPDFFSMTEEEHADALRLLMILRDKALREDSSITGFNIGTNVGRSAGQRVMHAHIHFIPRRDSDKGKPGGVKGVIRNKMAY